VSWQTDYHKARHEAREKGRPLLIDLGTESCYWCKQLDARTFTDAEVIQTLNARFVALKVDANRNPYLAQALRVQSYPTLVFASPEGKIVGFQEGFLEPAALKDKMRKVLAAVATPDWMTRDFDEAGKALGAGNSPRGIALLKNVVEDGKDRPIQQRARQMLQDLERQAAERLGRARDLEEKGKTEEALEALRDLGRAYQGTQAAGEGKQLAARLVSRPGKAAEGHRARRARELLEQARVDYRTGQYLCCLDRCETLAAQYADLPEGAEAGQLAAEIKGNPEWAKKAAEQLADRLCLLHLALAESWQKKGQPQQAVYYLQRIVQAFPNTPHAEVARARLARLQAPAGVGAQKR
jgi:thioredoxin-like negative regulator of GroEL